MMNLCQSLYTYSLKSAAPTDFWWGYIFDDGRKMNVYWLVASKSQKLILSALTVPNILNQGQTLKLTKVVNGFG